MFKQETILNISIYFDLSLIGKTMSLISVLRNAIPIDINHFQLPDEIDHSFNL